MVASPTQQQKNPLCPFPHYPIFVYLQGPKYSTYGTIGAIRYHKVYNIAGC